MEIIFNQYFYARVIKEIKIYLEKTSGKKYPA